MIYNLPLIQVNSFNLFAVFNQSQESLTNPMPIQFPNRILDALLDPGAIETSGFGYKLQAVFQLKK